MVRVIGVLLCFLVSVPAFAQWEQVTGPNVGNIKKVTKIGDDLFAAGGKSLYKSIDGGVNWQLLTSGLPSFFSISGFTIFNGDLFVSGGRAMYKQSSGTTTWTEINTGLPKNGSYPAPIFDFYIHNDSLYGISQRGPVVWIPSANSWQETGLSLKEKKPNYYVNAYIFQPDLWILALDSVFVSSDRGNSWKKATGFKENEQLRYFFREGSLLFCTGSNINKSSDNGLTWESFMGDRPYFSETEVVVSDGKLINFDQWSVWSSPVDSPVWTSTPLNVPYFIAPLTLLSEGTKLFGGFETQGVMVSSDGGVSWTKSNAGINNLDPERVWKLTDRVIFEMGSYEYWLYTISTSTWNQISIPNEFNLYNIEDDFSWFTEYNGKIIGATADLYESSDNGKTWQYLNKNSFETIAITDTLWVGINSNGPHVSYDQGKNWTQSNTGVGRLSASWIVAKDGIFAAANSPHGFFYSADGGRNWTKSNGGFLYPNGTYLTSLTWFDGYFYVTNDGAAGAPVWRSNDLTKNWSGFGGNLANNGAGYMVATDGNAMFYTGYSDGLAWMTSEQNQWTKYSTGLPVGERTVVVTVGKEVWVGVDGWGLFKTDGSTFTGAKVDVEDQEQTQPASFSLAGNYPNPFNPSTTIVLTVPVSTLLEISIYNSLGQLVARPVQNQLFGAGTHSIPFRGDNLASGSYWYQVKTDLGIKTGVMTLVK